MLACALRRVAVLAVVALVLPVRPVPAAAAEEVLIVGDDAFPPYSYLDDQGQPAGIYVEILREAASRMPDRRVRIELLPGRRALLMVETGRAHAVFPAPWEPADRPWMSYAGPLLTEVRVLVCRSDLPSLDLRQFPSQYEGVTFAAALGSPDPGPLVQRMADEGKVGLFSARDTREAVTALTDGRADCFVGDRAAIGAAARELPPLTALAGQLGRPVSGLVTVHETGRTRTFLGFAADAPDLTALRSEFDRALEVLHREGRIKHIEAAHAHGPPVAELTR